MEKKRKSSSATSSATTSCNSTVSKKSKTKDDVNNVVAMGREIGQFDLNWNHTEGGVKAYDIKSRPGYHTIYGGLWDEGMINANMRYMLKAFFVKYLEKSLPFLNAVFEDKDRRLGEWRKTHPVDDEDFKEELSEIKKNYSLYNEYDTNPDDELFVDFDFWKDHKSYFETFEGTFNFNGRKGKMWLDVQYFGSFHRFLRMDEESPFCLTFDSNMPIDVLKAMQKKFMEDDFYFELSSYSFFITEHVEQRIENLTDYFTTSFSKDYKKLPAEYCNIVQILKELPPTKYAVSFLTGYGEQDPANTATFVKLYDTELDMVVGKALLSYYNSEMGIPGPTIQLFEISKKYRRKKLGTIFYYAIETWLRLKYTQTQRYGNIGDYCMMATYLVNDGYKFFAKLGFKDNVKWDEKVKFVFYMDDTPTLSIFKNWDTK